MFLWLIISKCLLPVIYMHILYNNVLEISYLFLRWASLRLDARAKEEVTEGGRLEILAQILGSLVEKDNGEGKKVSYFLEMVGHEVEIREPVVATWTEDSITLLCKSSQKWVASQQRLTHSCSWESISALGPWERRAGCC